MVISSNRSPSPTIRKENIDSRAQEIGVRKSFNGNPLIRHTRPASTPANSPTDFIRRSLGQKEGLRCSYDSKENEKDQKKMRDCERTKGGKSFMAPTISAISKISSPSPRKKVLSDRNEMVRSSISESEGKNFMGGGDLEVEEHLSHVSKPETGFDSQVISESHVKLYKPRALEFQESEADSPIAFLIPEAVSKIAPPVTSSSPSLATKYDSATKNSSLKARPLPSPSSAMSPLDSDPHLPPYDPKTNYLSPRPQFLHYRPKPRVEVKKLEDSFPSDASISSDTETTEDTLSSGSFKESEEDSSSEVLSEISSTEPNHCPSKASPKSKSRSCFRSKTICLLLVFALACAFIPVSETPVLSPSAYKDQTFRFDELATVAKFARENLHGLASNIKIWSAQTFSYVSGLISGPDVVPDLGPPLHFSNWTIPSEPVGFDEFQYHQLDKVDVEIELGEEIMELEMVTDGEDCEMVADGKEMPLEEVVSNVESQKVEEVYPVAIETEELPVVMDTEELPAMITEDLEMATEGGEEVVYDVLHLEMTTEIHSVVTEEHSPVIEVESLDSPPQHSEVDLSTTQVPELDVLPETIVELDSTSAQFVEPDTASLDASSPIQTLGLDSTLYAVTATVAFVALVAILVYSYLKHRKPTTEVQEPLNHRKTTTEVQELLLKNIMSSGNCEPQVEMVGESGPEMSSSFKRSLSYSVRVNEEAHSHEKRPRHAKRESLASSADCAAGSVSYGSYTTFLPSKDVLGEDEVMTPVRRSSRIRKITSPSA